MRVWTCFRTGGESLGPEAVARALMAAGLEPIDETAPHAGPALLFFDTVLPDLYDLVRRISGAGVERLLAIAATPLLLAGPACSL